MAIPEMTSPLNPAWDLVSVATEVVAFFMVTVELYGEERLRSLQEQLASLIRRVVGGFRNIAGRDDPFWIGSTVGFLGRIVVAGIAFYLAYLIADHPNPPGTPRVVVVSTDVLVAFLALFSCALLFSYPLIRLLCRSE